MKIFRNINEIEYDDEGYICCAEHSGILYGMEKEPGYFGILFHYEKEYHDIVAGIYLFKVSFYIGLRWKEG